jgi:chromosome partitioning protein
VGQLDILPSSDTLLSYEYSINNEAGGEYLLKEVLESKEYDYILIDTPPSLGSLTINALVASNYYIVPMQGENFAYVGLDRILQIAGKVKKRMNSKLELSGVLLLKFDIRTKFGQVVYEKLSNDSKINLFKTFIRQDISLMEATAFQQNIFEYAPDSRGASDFSSLANEILIQNEQKTI